MADGLLGSFDNVMAGLTADEIDALAEPVAAPAPPSTHVGPSPDAVVDPSIDPSAELPIVAPHRVVDPRAQEVADRLLRRTRSAAHQSVIVPDRASAVSARLVIIVDSPDALDGAGGADVENFTINDGDVITIGRGDIARPADRLQLLVPYGVVSRQHCRVVRSGNVVTVADAGSANGTVIVRDAQVVTVGREPAPLVSGDVVATAGGHRPIVRFEIDCAPASAPDPDPDDGAVS